MTLNYIKNDDLPIKREELKQYKYRLEVNLINIADEAVPLDDLNISMFTVENFYNTHYMGLVELRLIIDNDTYYKFMENRKEVKINLKMFKTPMTQEEDFREPSDPDSISWEMIYEDTYMPIFKEETFLKEKELIEEATDKSEHDKLQTKWQPNRSLDLYLFSEKILKSNKKVVNAVFKEIKVFNVIGYILNTCKIDKVLINKSHNDELYTQIIVPPLVLKESIIYLHNYYGVYRSGIKAFHDYDMLYLLNNDFDERITDAEDNYVDVLIYMLRFDDTRQIMEGCYKDDKEKKYKINLPDNLIQINTALVSKETFGNKMKVYDNRRIKYGTAADDADTFSFGSGNRLVDLRNEGHYSEDNVKYLRNNMENDLLLQSKIYLSKDSNLSVSLSMSDMDITYFKPNKVYKFEFEQEKSQEIYSGEYRLNSFRYSLGRNTSTMIMEMNAVAEFSKIIK